MLETGSPITRKLALAEGGGGRRDHVVGTLHAQRGHVAASLLHPPVAALGEGSAGADGNLGIAVRMGLS